VDLLSEYTFTIQHRAGKSHSNADALSRILPCEENGDPCKQCHKHIRELFNENTETGEEKVEYARVRVLRVSAVDDRDNEAEDTDHHTADTAPVLIDLRDPCPSSSSSSYEITSPPTVEEFIVLDDSEDQSYIQCSQISTKRIYVQPPRNRMIMSPIMDCSIILPPVIHSPYVPHEDFRPNSPLSKQRNPPPDADSDNTDTALRFAENSQCFHMSEQVHSGGSEGAETLDTGSVHGNHTPARTTAIDVSNTWSITTSPPDAKGAAPLPTSSLKNTIQPPYHTIDYATLVALQSAACPNIQPSTTEDLSKSCGIDPGPTDVDHTPTKQQVFHAASIQPLSCCQAIQAGKRTRAATLGTPVDKVTVLSGPVHQSNEFTEKFVMIIEPFQLIVGAGDITGMTVPAILNPNN